MFYCVFFFQAEDGIRDLVRSRGLGDVYKRQGNKLPYFNIYKIIFMRKFANDILWGLVVGDALGAVSYTHLTLPTSDLV